MPRGRRLVHLDEGDDTDDYSELDQTFPGGSQSFLSQSTMNLSQIQSQSSSHFGQFSYFAYERKGIPRPLQNKRIPYTNSLFATSYRQMHLHTLTELVDVAKYNFQECSQENVNFFRFYLRLYPRYKRKPDSMNWQAYFNFIEQTLPRLLERNLWSRARLLEIFHDPKREMTEVDYIFNMIQYMLKGLLNGHDGEHPDHEDILLNLHTPMYLFKLLVDFFSHDFRIFLQSSGNFFTEIGETGEDQKPLWTRMLWPGVRRPDYVTSTFKKFIYLLVRVVQEWKYFAGSWFDDDLDEQLARPIFELFRMSAEMLRIGAGNARPYLTLYSSRNLSCYELYLGLAKSNLTDPSSLFYVLDNLRPMPWLQCQMILIILSKQFLYKTPSLMIGGHARKVKLSVRLILEVFLMGEVNLFQKHQFEQMKKIREVTPAKPKTTTRKRVQAKNKLSGGATLIHQYCRDGKVSSGKSLRQLVAECNPNQTDDEGLTPMMYAVRRGRLEALQNLILESSNCGIDLSFDATAFGAHGWSALHYAMIERNREIIELLLQYGGPGLLTVVNKDDETPEDLLGPEDPLREFLKTVDFTKNAVNCLPDFKQLARDIENPTPTGSDQVNSNKENSDANEKKKKPTTRGRKKEGGKKIEEEEQEVQKKKVRFDIEEPMEVDPTTPTPEPQAPPPTDPTLPFQLALTYTRLISTLLNAYLETTCLRKYGLGSVTREKECVSVENLIEHLGPQFEAIHVRPAKEAEDLLPVVDDLKALCEFDNAVERFAEVIRTQFHDDDGTQKAMDLVWQFREMQMRINKDFPLQILGELFSST